MCWVIKSTSAGGGDRLHTVGYYEPNAHPDYTAAFVAHRDFSSADEAARYIHWLNGGNSTEAWFEGDKRR